MRHHLDWSSYETAGQGDAYAGIPATGGDFAKAVAVCINDRLCQRKPKGVMCPSFRATDDPADSPGGRVQVLKAALNGEFGEEAFADARLTAAMDLCVGCKGCKRECANQVDMAAIKIEVQAQRNARLGVPLRDRLFAGLPRWLQHHRLLRGLVRWRNRSPILARLGERWLGIAARRRLPEPALQPYAPPHEIANNGAAGERDVIHAMLTAAMLGLIEQTGLDIIVLTEELDDREFFASRLTRLQTFQLLGSLAETAHNLPAEVRARLSPVDWDAWAALPAALARPDENAFRIWVAAKELTPLTVQSLIDYKRVYPELFALAP